LRSELAPGFALISACNGRDRSFLVRVRRRSQETGGAGSRASDSFVLSKRRAKQKRGLRRAFICFSDMETHRLMRYCTAQFSRNER